MIGTFVTRCYASRCALNLGLPSKVHVSRNRFTDAGMDWMWRMMIGDLRDADGTLSDHLGSARLIVGNGSRDFEPSDTRLVGPDTGQAELDGGYPLVAGVIDGGDGPDACRLTFRATFGEEVANFDWAERGVVTAQGVLLDRSVEDQGRKVLGQVWTLEASLDLTR